MAQLPETICLSGNADVQMSKSGGGREVEGSEVKGLGFLISDEACETYAGDMRVPKANINKSNKNTNKINI